MARLPVLCHLHKYKIMKHYLSCYIFPCEKYFCSKDVPGESTFEQKTNQDKEKEKEKTAMKKDADSSNVADKQSKDAAKKKLFSLLSEIKIMPEQKKIKPDLMLSRPVKRPKKTERFKHLISEKTSPDEEMKNAVTSVAESIGGNVEEIKIQLHEKLTDLNLMDNTSDKGKKYVSENLGIDDKLQENLMSSIKDVASTVSTPVRSKLTQRLLKLSIDKKEEGDTKLSIESMMKGMKIEKSIGNIAPSERTQDDVRLKIKQQTSQREKPIPKIKLFEAPPLDIFSEETIESKEEQSTIWQGLEKKRLKLLTEFAPTNAFEEMIMWTEQGKHWKFPIDNEIDIGEEENVGFHEHIFLEQHLQGFPTKGPIRHFMELVAIGLSKNPYISVERKIENIEWFREYLKDKEDILKEYGAI